MWCELGFLKELIYRDDNQAKDCYKVALELGNSYAEYNIAVSCEKLGQLNEAENLYRKILNKSPNCEDYKLALGMCLLKQKKFNEGYKYFTDRTFDFNKYKTTNLWKYGDNIDNKIAIASDQGYGDQIQFIRYLPFLKGKDVKIIASQPLIELFRNNYPDFEFVKLADYNEKDRQMIRITDLAYALNMNFDKIPFAEGYLELKPLNIISEKLKVGLCWEAGSAGTRTLINRTIHIKCFEPFFNLENIQFYSFQYDDTFNGNIKYPQMINLAKDFKNFYDTASALKSMDIVITVDTAVAHLAGALGVRTYLLLPYFTDWRWFSDTKNTPWYKSIEIFKQQNPISWELPFKEIYKRLETNII